MTAAPAASISPLRFPQRRSFLIRSGQVGLSAAAVALLAGCESMTQTHAKGGMAQQDVAILNTALGLEHEAIAAYQLGAESGLLRSRTSISPSPSRAITRRMPTCCARLSASSAARRSRRSPITTSLSEAEVADRCSRLRRRSGKGARSAPISAPCRSSRTAISPRPPPASSATRRCIGRPCAMRWGCRPPRTHSSPRAFGRSAARRRLRPPRREGADPSGTAVAPCLRANEQARCHAGIGRR